MIYNPNPYNKCRYLCIECKFYENCFIAWRNIFEFSIDFYGCNLNCILCWTKNENEKNSIKNITVDDITNRLENCFENYSKTQIKNKINSFQIVGGEPFLEEDRMFYISKLIKKIDIKMDDWIKIKRTSYFNRVNNEHRNKIKSENSLISSELFKDEINESIFKKDKNEKYLRIKIFTNGILFKEKQYLNFFNNSIIDLKKTKIKILFSLKGTNEYEYKILQKNPNYSFRDQVKALNNFIELLNNNSANFEFELIIGFYHSKKFLIIDKNENYLKFDFSGEDDLKSNIKSLLNHKKIKLFVEPLHVPFKTKENDFLKKNKEIIIKNNDSRFNDLKDGRKTIYWKTPLLEVFNWK